MTASSGRIGFSGTRPATRAPADNRRLLQIAIILATLGGVLYNSVLAFFGARGLPLSSGIVTLAEAMLLSFTVLILFMSGLRNSDVPAIAFMLFAAMIALLVSILSDSLFPDGLRNFVVIGLFLMLGERTERLTLQWAFIVATIVVVIFLILELISTPLYVSIFHPADYYEKTRGMTQSALDDSGLFRSAQGIASRFSFGVFSSHRTSSTFLEQVSLANYAAVLSVFAISVWSSLRWWARLLYIATILLILLTNNTRTSSTLAVVFLAGYFLFPLLPRYMSLAVPVAVLAAATVITLMFPGHYEDDLIGRVSITMRGVQAIDVPAMLGRRAPFSRSFADSGYPYVVYSTTLFGLLAFWALVSFVIPQRSAAEKRCAYGLSVYVFANLLIGGTAIFSIKTGAPLWLLVGHMRRGSVAKPVSTAAAAA